MSVVLAALDTTAAARPVLETALGVGALTGAHVEAVHVRDGPADTPRLLTDRSGVPLLLLDGPVETALLGAFADPDVAVAVLGARATPGGRRPTGRTALHILQRADRPVVVVPPDAVRISPRPFRRLLVPLEGTASSSAAVTDVLCPLLATDVELIVVHVFTPGTLPRVLDRPVRDMELLGGEFLARHRPDGAGIQLRTGAIAAQIAAVCAEETADLIVLSWSQDSTAGRAPVVSDLLGCSTVPILLLPVAGGDFADAAT